jgi:hypothetical protein
MNTCDICGKVSSEVAFDPVRGKHLCISCRFGSGEFHTKKFHKETEQQEPSGEQAAQASSQPSGAERRKHIRVPVLISLDVQVGGMTSQIFYTASLENFSKGGICIDWEHCDECLGYAEGKIHPFCIFSQFNIKNNDSKELTIKVELDNLEEVLQFKGKAAYTLKKSGKEYIGITFTDITPDVLAKLEEIC